MSPVSTMGVGIAADGTVERYVPPRVIEEAGGGGPPPGPGPLLSSAAAFAPSPTATFTSWQTLALPAGTFDVWMTLRCTSAGAATNGSLNVSLDGVTALPASATAVNQMAPLMSLVAGTPAVEITLAAPQTIHGGGSFATGGANITVDNVRLFARQLA